MEGLSKTSRSSLFVAILMSLLGLLIYSNTFAVPFYYDDYRNIVNNPNIYWDELSLDNLKKLFSLQSDLPSGRVFSFLTFALNYYFNGLEVWGYHLVNLGVHILTALGFFLFLKSLLVLPQFENRWCKQSFTIALISSLLWFVSPLQTQSVTYIVQRMASLAAMFYVYSMYFYVRGRIIAGSKRYMFYSFSALSLLFAFASKENAYVLPFFLLALEFIVFRRGDYQFFLKKNTIILVLLLALFLMVGFWYLCLFHLDTQPGSWLIYQYKTRFFTGFRSFIFYICQILLPLPSWLSLIHDFQISTSMITPPSTFFAIMFVFFIVFYAIKCFKKNPLFSFFTLWFFGNLVIETFLPNIIMIFEHRIYLPSMGLFSIVGLCLNNIREYSGQRLFKFLLNASISIVVLLFSFNTYERNLVWGDSHRFWIDTIKKSPNMSAGYLGLGSAHLLERKYQFSLENYLIAKSLSPRNPDAILGLAISYFYLGEYKESVGEFVYLSSMKLDNANINSKTNYYVSKIVKKLYNRGDIVEANKAIDGVLKYKPGDVELVKLKIKIGDGSN